MFNKNQQSQSHPGDTRYSNRNQQRSHQQNFSSEQQGYEDPWNYYTSEENNLQARYGSSASSGYTSRGRTEEDQYNQRPPSRAQGRSNYFPQSFDSGYGYEDYESRGRREVNRDSYNQFNNQED